MARDRRPISKICRRDGLSIGVLGNYEGSAKKATERKNYPPGAHGKKGTFSKQSEYGKQLREKQKAKNVFGILERQFRKYYEKATKSEEASGFALMKMLEKRLDNVIYKAGIAETRRAARQIVSHGHVNLNGKRVNIPSIEVSIGDKFEIRTKSKESKLYETAKKKKPRSPKWINVDLKNLSGEILNEPGPEDIEKLIDSQLIVEYYSK